MTDATGRRRRYRCRSRSRLSWTSRRSSRTQCGGTGKDDEWIRVSFILPSKDTLEVSSDWSPGVTSAALHAAMILLRRAFPYSLRPCAEAALTTMRRLVNRHGHDARDDVLQPGDDVSTG
jgi:hypothetical protein